MATRIMLVDDDKNMTESLQTMLKSRGHRSVEAADCDHAFPLFSRERFDLILVDPSLPDNSGFRGDELLKGNRGDGPAIVISSPNALKTLAMKPPLWASFSRNVTSMIRLSSITQLTESDEHFHPLPRRIDAASTPGAQEGFDAVGVASQRDRPGAIMRGRFGTIIVALAALAVLSFATGCSEDPPSVRVTNQRATKANVQIKQANGNTINHNDVTSGAASNFQDIAEGAIVVTAVIQNETVSPTTAFFASKDNTYTIVILGGDPPSLKVDTQSK